MGDMDANQSGPEGSTAAAWEARAWRRLLAGILVEQGAGNKDVAERWQAMVKSGDFDPDRFAEELLDSVDLHSTDTESKVLTRSTRLERDLLMTPLLKGASGASRKVRGAVKSGTAALVTQVVVVLVMSLLAFLLLLVLSFKGVKFDPFFQAIIDWIPALPDSNA